MVKQIQPFELKSIISQNILDENCYFVFSTDVVKNSWIDWIVTNPNESGTSAVPLERFTAWDNFKSEFIKGKEKNKIAIPSTLRKFWVQNLIQENAKNVFLKKLINPLYAKDASSFTDWIEQMLPSLKKWNDLRQTIDEEFDDEDSDFALLFEKYNAFLEKNSMFEPSWIEPDFKTTNKRFIIIFPEILSDFADYIDTLSENQNITLVTLSQQYLENASPLCYQFSDARKELRRILLSIRKLRESGVLYQDINLNVPDLETYRPYLEREFSKYCIPYVIRAGLPLINNGPGAIFTKILECCKTNFSYNSVRSLILDEYIPWNEDSQILRENVIKEGCRMHCLCNYEEKDGSNVDIWEKALSNVAEDKREYDFYKKLKSRLLKMYNSKTFSDIFVGWEMFKSEFLCTKDFSTTANNIISRCIIHLKEYSLIEQTFCEQNNIVIESPYTYFISELSKKTYTPQTENVGVNVYPYRLAAAANAKYQFVIDASQANLEVVYKSMSFLNNEKRKKLGLVEKDKTFNPSKAFIALYAKDNEANNVMFSFSEESFAGFSIVHNYLKLATTEDGKTIENPLSELDKEDFIVQENNAFLSSSLDPLSSFSENQKVQFENWWLKNKNRIKNLYEDTTLSDPLKQNIVNELITKRNVYNEDKDKVVITQSDMKAFFNCPRFWLFSKAIKLKEETLDTKLLNNYDMGNINHKILELLMNSYKTSKAPLPFISEEDNFMEKTLLYEKVKKFAKDAVNDFSQNFHDSPLSLIMLNSQIENITTSIMNFLEVFLSKFGGYYVFDTERKTYKSIENQDYAYYGIIDLILLNNNIDSNLKDMSILDYKNSGGATPSKKDCYISEPDQNGEQILQDFQIPMYVSLLYDDKNVFIQNAAFCTIKSPKIASIIDEEKNPIKDYIPTLQAFDQYAQIFNEKVRTFDFIPDPNIILPYEACVKCKCKAVCRYSYTVGNKNIVEGN